MCGAVRWHVKDWKPLSAGRNINPLEIFYAFSFFLSGFDYVWDRSNLYRSYIYMSRLCILMGKRGIRVR
jgi:hypothetical protein